MTCGIEAMRPGDVLATYYRSGELPPRRVNGPELELRADPFDLAAQDASHVLGHRLHLLHLERAAHRELHGVENEGEHEGGREHRADQ